MKPGDKYLNGNIDFGAMGKQKLMILPNEKKEGRQPDHYAYIKDGEDLKRVGAFWVNKKKGDSDVDVEEQKVF